MIRMKQVATKITEYVKKSKRAKLYGVFGLIYLIAVIFVMNDAWLYQTPIAKLTKVETSIAGENKSTRGTQEIKYKQKIRGVILNGTNKGKIVDFSNEYTYTGMLKQKYHKGDKVLLNGSESNVGSSIQSVKRDTELVVLLGLLIFALMTIAGKKGVLTIITVGINIVIFSVGFLKSGDDADVVGGENLIHLVLLALLEQEEVELLLDLLLTAHAREVLLLLRAGGDFRRGLVLVLLRVAQLQVDRAAEVVDALQDDLADLGQLLVVVAHDGVALRGVGDERVALEQKRVVFCDLLLNARRFQSGIGRQELPRLGTARQHALFGANDAPEIAVQPAVTQLDLLPFTYCAMERCVLRASTCFWLSCDCCMDICEAACTDGSRLLLL